MDLLFLSSLHNEGTSMQVDFIAMGKELGVRADIIRLRLNIPTRLQRLIRNTRTFQEISALSGDFAEDSSRNSCGPKFESEEKAEYEARRKEFFPAYLDHFQTIDDFKGFGRMDSRSQHSPSFELESEELEAATKKLESLMLEKAEAAQDNLDALLEIRTIKLSFASKGLRTLQWFDLNQKILQAFIAELKNASDVNERIKIIAKMPESRYNLFERYVPQNNYPWAFVWEEVSTLDEAMLLEGLPEDQGSFILNEPLQNRMLLLLEEVVRKMPGFAERLAYAENFARRERYNADKLYSRALELSAEEIKEKGQLTAIIDIWQGRRAKNGSSSFHGNWDELPQIILDKWDAFYLTEAETTEDMKQLVDLARSSSGASKTYRTAQDRIESHFDRILSQAQSVEEVERIEAEAKALYQGLHIHSYTRRQELERQKQSQEIQKLWDLIEQGKAGEEERRILIGLYHEFKKKDPEKTRIILKRLAKYFPAEVMDEVEVEA